MTNDLITNLLFLGGTACMLALIFAVLIAVGHKRNKAFRDATPEEKSALFSRAPHNSDIVLLSDGTRVTLLESADGGENWDAETVNDYGKRPVRVLVKKENIVKIEYFS